MAFVTSTSTPTPDRVSRKRQLRSTLPHNNAAKAADSSATHQPMKPQDHEHGASPSHGVPVYLPASACTNPDARYYGLGAKAAGFVKTWRRHSHPNPLQSEPLSYATPLDLHL